MSETLFTLRMPDPLRNQVRAIAQREYVSESAIIRQLLVRALNIEQANQPQSARGSVESPAISA